MNKKDAKINSKLSKALRDARYLGHYKLERISSAQMHDMIVRGLKATEYNLEIEIEIPSDDKFDTKHVSRLIEAMTGAKELNICNGNPQDYKMCTVCDWEWKSYNITGYGPDMEWNDFKDGIATLKNHCMLIECPRTIDNLECIVECKNHEIEKLREEISNLEGDLHKARLTRKEFELHSMGPFTVAVKNAVRDVLQQLTLCGDINKIKQKYGIVEDEE